ncbi:MAG: galactokinase [Bacteroidaceae bacterium]|nr:galactokinase [Bacteroidaceae bacterium]
MDTTILRNRFREQYGNSGDLYFSPGRINLIGEHTDYNGGFVFPGAVDKGITLEISVNGSRLVRLLAIDQSDAPYLEFSLDDQEKPDLHWACYIFGVCKELEKRGVCLAGFNAAFTGDVPLGAGMSSSAALESVFAFALNDMFAGGSVDRFELAKIGQATEHNYCGVKCGIMDQFASVFGKEGNLIRLDCRSLEYEYFPFDPKGYRLVLINSCVSHSLGGEYNERRESCEKAVALMAKRWKGVETLRDASHDMLDAVKSELDNEDWLRAKYILDEKERVLAVCDALNAGDYDTVGKKMYETHWGLSREYTVSCPELDFLVETAQECGVTGSRIMGGGFGGCTINLVRETLCDKFISKATREYSKRFGVIPKVYHVVIGDGSRKLK